MKFPGLIRTVGLLHGCWIKKECAGNLSHFTNSDEGPILFDYHHWWKDNFSLGPFYGPWNDEQVAQHEARTRPWQNIWNPAANPRMPLLVGSITGTDYGPRHSHEHPRSSGAVFSHNCSNLEHNLSSLVSHLPYNKSTSLCILSAKRQLLKCY